MSGNETIASSIWGGTFRFEGALATITEAAVEPCPARAGANHRCVNRSQRQVSVKLERPILLKPWFRGGGKYCKRPPLIPLARYRLLPELPLRELLAVERKSLTVRERHAKCTGLQREERDTHQATLAYTAPSKRMRVGSGAFGKGDFASKECGARPSVERHTYR